MSKNPLDDVYDVFVVYVRYDGGPSDPCDSSAWFNVFGVYLDGKTAQEMRDMLARKHKDVPDECFVIERYTLV